MDIKAKIDLDKIGDKLGGLFGKNNYIYIVNL